MNTYVTLDGYNVFPAAQVNEAAWNGWATAGFTRAQADALAAHLAEEQKQHPDTTVPVWQELYQAYRMVDAAYPDDTVGYIRPDGDGLYWIGAYEWTWSVYEGDHEAAYVLGRIVLHGPTDGDDE